jgi:hypothetical protein
MIRTAARANSRHAGLGSSDSGREQDDECSSGLQVFAYDAFLITGSVSLGDIAATLELPVDQLAVLWNDLPLSERLKAAVC